MVGAFQMVRAARSLLEAAPQPGAVVNTASIAGVVGNGSSVPYAASKGALDDHDPVAGPGPGARRSGSTPSAPASSTRPGSARPWTAERVDRLRASAAAATPLKVASTAEDIAGSAVFLASPASRHVTGETLLVDAGLHLGGASPAMR